MRPAGRLLVAGTAAGTLLGTAPPAEAAPKRIRFESTPGSSLLVHGVYPRFESSCVRHEQPLLHARFRGTVEVGTAADGLFVIGEVPFEDYLKGIAEVPRRWPVEALKAQVVAARTYAMSRLRLGSSEGRALGYDLCATTACQVYLGMGVEAGPWGQRWVRAVEQTEGQILLYDGKPADTLYSSTSPGRTYGNERVFGGAPLPYLRPIKERGDRESPLAHWTVRFPFGDLSRFLRAAGLWSGAPVRTVVGRNDLVVIRGSGERLRLTREELRDALNGVASCLDRDYPSREPDGYRLPQTVPSHWYRTRTEGRALILDGRGWGHGVGMVQWGAKGKADRGLTYDQILGAYYGGLRPQQVRTPGVIRVLIADGLKRVTVVPSQDADVVGPKAPPPAPWTVRARRLRVRTGRAPAPVLEARPGRPTVADGMLAVPVKLSAGALVRIEALDGDSVADTSPWMPLAEGRHRVPVSLDLDDDIDGLRLVADD